MPDPYLEAMMRGEFPHKKAVPSNARIKDKFEAAIEREINQYIDTLHLEDDFLKNRLLPPGAQRTKILLEMKGGVSFSRLESYLTASLEILHSEGNRYLSEEPFLQMEKEFSQIPLLLELLDVSKELTDTFQTIFNISDPVMASILKVAIAKFDEEQYEQSLALLAFLSTLAPGNFDYWFRLGIVAQRAQNYELALNSYAVAADLNPQLIGAKLFAIECYLQKEQPDKAIKALEEAKQIAESNDIASEWRDLLQKIALDLKPLR